MPTSDWNKVKLTQVLIVCAKIVMIDDKEFVEILRLIKVMNKDY